MTFILQQSSLFRIKDLKFLVSKDRKNCNGTRARLITYYSKQVILFIHWNYYPKSPFKAKGLFFQNKTASKLLKQPTPVFYHHCPAADAKVFVLRSSKVWVNSVHGFSPHGEWFSYCLCFDGATPTLHNMAHVVQRSNKKVKKESTSGLSRTKCFRP